MKRTSLLIILISIFSIFFIAYSALSDETIEDIDKTLSPYFFVKSDDSAIDQLPLKSTSAKVNIAGVIADVVVSQVYKNEGEYPLEAIYVFPASTRAAVYGMKMTIGERTIVAEIQRKEEARESYEKAKQEGKSASLLEQQRPNVFQMNVANIMPNDEIKVELSYTELLIPTDNTYEFVYPTVVGPRYSDTPAAMAEPTERWVENPYLHEGEAPPYTFDIQITLSTGLPLQHVSCNTHMTDIQYEGESVAIIELNEEEKYGGNRDFILKYQLAGMKIESGLLLYEGEDENFFLLMVQPPKKVGVADITPREFIFIIDVSGSMYGFPIEISKRVLTDLISNLAPEDKFNVLLFASGYEVMSNESLPATEENIQSALDLINNKKGSGGTQILPALQKALALPRNEGTSRTIVIVTDGYVSVELEVFDLIRNNLGEANLFAFGIGSSVNRYIIEGMAHVGMGEPFIITKQSEAPVQGEKFRQYISTPVLTEVDVNFGEFDAYDIEPPNIPDVLAERPIICFGKWRGEPRGKIELNGYSGEGEYTAAFNVGDVLPMDENSALKYLWARHRIMILGDYNKLSKSDERVELITELGLKYNLLTDYTSFVAIDSLIRNEGGESTTVKQALPLPQGVSDYAVGSSTRSGSSYSSSQPASSYSASAWGNPAYGGTYGGTYGATAGGTYGAAAGGTSPPQSTTSSRGFSSTVSPTYAVSPSFSAPPGGGNIYQSTLLSTIWGFPNALPLIQPSGPGNLLSVTGFPGAPLLTQPWWPSSAAPLLIGTNINQFIPTTSIWGFPTVPPSIPTWESDIVAPPPSNLALGNISVEKVSVISNEKFKNEIMDIIRTNLYALSFCGQGTNSGGSVEVRIEIDNNGTIISSSITKNDVGKIVGECLINQIKKWNFTGLNNITTLIVEIHFRLT
ncbi:MAG: VIT domain-containing protein [bacterium]